MTLCKTSRLRRHIETTNFITNFQLLHVLAFMVSIRLRNKRSGYSTIRLIN